MTLGPDRQTVLRWLREPFYNPDGDGAGGGGGASGDSGKNGDGKGTEGDGKGKTGTEGDGKNGDAAGTGKRVVTFEHEGKTYVLQDHVNELVGNARVEGTTKGKQEAIDEANRKALEAQGDYKKLYEDAEVKRKAAEAERDEANLKTIRRSIGAKYGLSEKLSDRLQGKTEKEIEADAKEIAEEQGIDPNDPKKKVTPTSEGGKGSKSGTSKTAVGSTDADAEAERKRQASRRFVFTGDKDVKREGW